MANWKTLFYGTLMAGSVATGMSACTPKEPKETENQNDEDKNVCPTYGEFKKCMQPITPQVMLETILVEGVKFDENGLCRPYLDSKGVWTIGFGLTVLDGVPVNANTRHITIQEAWEKSVKFYENRETYFFMWCYEIGIDGLCIDTKEKALCLASVMYNSGNKLMEDPSDTKYNCERSAILRDLYKQCGDSVTMTQVQELFTQYPIKYPRSFGAAVNGGDVKDWANALGGFTPKREGGGIKWRRWLEGQIAMGNITPADLLDLPMKSMSDFWDCIGKDKSVLFTKQKDGSWRVNPEGLKRFKQWCKNPVDKNGNKINRKTLRQVLNSIDPNLVLQVQNGTYSPKPNDTYVVKFDEQEIVHTCREQNDTSYLAYKRGDYETALRAGKEALKLASDSLEYGASNYNIGIAYVAKGKYAKAVHYLEQSLAYNDRPVTRDALADAQQKRDEQKHHRRDVAKNFALGTAIVGTGVAYGRKRYMMKNQRHR